MALTSITMVTGANILKGRALARNGALTLDTNRITPPAGRCTVSSVTVPGTGAASMLPGLGIGFVMVIIGGLILAVGRRRAKSRN